MKSTTKKEVFEEIKKSYMQIYETLDEKEQRAFDMGETYGLIRALLEENEDDERGNKM